MIHDAIVGGDIVLTLIDECTPLLRTRCLNICAYDKFNGSYGFYFRTVVSFESLSHLFDYRYLRLSLIGRDEALNASGCVAYFKTPSYEIVQELVVSSLRAFSNVLLKVQPTCFGCC